MTKFIQNITSRYLEPDSDPIHPDVEFGQNVRIGYFVVIEEDCKIGDDTYIGDHVVIKADSIIGKHCRIGHGCIFEGRGKIGDRVTIMPNGQICLDGVIEDDVFIGPNYIGLNTMQIVHGRGRPAYNPPVIKRAARIGGGVIVMPGVIVGENALVAAGSLVTKNVPDRTVVMGAPAKIIRMVEPEELL
jgi:UDP-2-acetamido-3-amino-2,3-dideoxy-glucuronate N-acetyltransferase